MKDISRRIIAISSKVAVDADDTDAETASLAVIDSYKNTRMKHPVSEFDVLVMLMAAGTIAMMFEASEH